LFPGGVATGYEILPFQGKDYKHQVCVDTIDWQLIGCRRRQNKIE